MIHLISVLGDMVFMIRISVSKGDCVPSKEGLRGHFLASVIILQLTQFNATNIF